ncbi:MAG: hypothetical protein ABJ118_16975, partial [Luteolibacter sp.]
GVVLISSQERGGEAGMESSSGTAQLQLSVFKHQGRVAPLESVLVFSVQFSVKRWLVDAAGGSS